MPRLPIGVYVVGNQIVRFGRRDRDPRAGERFHSVTDPASRSFLADGELELEDLRWNGTSVVRRAQSEIDARLRAYQIAQDDASFEREREKALMSVLLDEINVLRQGAGLAPRTVEQAKSTYTAKMNR